MRTIIDNVTQTGENDLVSARTRVRAAIRVAASLGAPALLVGLLVWPMLFTGGAFNEDWPNHLWYVWNQSLAIRESHQPSLFLNYVHSVFYPEYAFYGGTLYAIVGTLSVLLGGAIDVAYVSSYVLGFAAAYGGWYWLARMAGIQRWWAHVPSLVFITSPYYLTLIWARGDLQEFVGVSTIPLLIGAGLAVLRAERFELIPALAFVGSGVIFFGSHNLTIVWASTLAVVTCGFVLAGIPEARRRLRRGAVLRVALMGTLALLVNAWFLLPAVAYQSHTYIGASMAYWRTVLRSAMFLVAASRLFALMRESVFPGADFVLALPVLAMVWASTCIFIYARGSRRTVWFRMLLICAALAACVTVLMAHATIVSSLPHPYALLQYAYRLESYVILAVTGAVLVGLVLAQRTEQWTRIWRWALIPVLIAAVYGAIKQTDAYPDGGRQNMAVEARAPTKGVLGDYVDVHLPRLEDRAGRPPEVVFPTTAIPGRRLSEVVHFLPHQLVYSNIGAGPELVDVSGAKIVGRDPEGNMVLEIERASGNSDVSPVHRGSRPTEVIAVGPASSVPVVLGRLLSLAAIAILAALFAAHAVGGARSFFVRGAPGKPHPSVAAQSSG